MSDAVSLKGGCACGALRYRLTAAPMMVHCCHCLECQNQTGSAFVVNALIEDDRFEVECGATRAVRMPTSSGRRHVIHRCHACGVAVWSVYSADRIRFVRAGTLGDPSVLEPGVHIYTRSKLPWVALPEGVPAFSAYYDAQTVWPAESLARRKAVLG